MNKNKFPSKMFLVCLAALVLVSLATMGNASASGNIVDEMVSLIFDMDTNEDAVDFLVVLDSIEDPQSFAEAYDEAFSWLSSSTEDDLNDFSLAVQAFTEIVLALEDAGENLDGDQLKSYLEENTLTNRENFKNALVGSNEAEIISEFNSKGITADILERGLAKMDVIYAAFTRIQVNPLINSQFLEATRKYANLDINNSVADGMISLAEGAGIISAHDNSGIIDDLQVIVDYYNGCSSTDKTIIYDYLNSFGLIKIVSSGSGGSTTDSDTEPDDTDDTAVQTELQLPKPTVTDGIAKAEVDQDDFAEAVDDAVDAAVELAEQLADNGDPQTIDIYVTVVLEVPETGAESVEVALPAGAVDAAFAAGVDEVKVITELAEFSITQETFGDMAVGKEIVLGAREVPETEIPVDADIPQGSLVVDLNAYIDGEKVTDFAKAIKVAIPYNGTATDGESITVFILKDDHTVEAVGGNYDAETGQVVFLTKHFSKYFAKQSRASFGDIDNYAWAKDAIEIMGGKGIINGVDANHYAPARNITRAEFCALVTRMFQLTGSTDKVFADIETDAWYYDEVMAAYANGIIAGDSLTTFNPNGLITRQEMAVIVARVLNSYGYLAADRDQLADYVDQALVADWAKDGMALVVREKIIMGVDSLHLAPNNNATRAESAVILYRIFGKLIK